MKIEDDKYYTPIDLANHCWDVLFSVIPQEEITDIIEPSCGNGSFYHYEVKPNFGVDIAPEFEGANIIKADYLSLTLMYKKGRLIIGNPPFGSRLSLATKFFKKSADISDYIAFILPISQLNNTRVLYEFDLIYSEDLGIQDYSGRELHCCFNVYKRPHRLHKSSVAMSNDIEIYRQDCNGYKDKEFDIRIAYWGDGCAGKILTSDEQYAGEYKIKILNSKYRQDIYDFITTFDWQNYISGIAMKRLKQYHIIEALYENLPYIKQKQNLLF